MPLTYDFVDTLKPATSTITTSWSLTNTDSGMKFTLSKPDPGVGLSFGYFGNNGNPTTPLYMSVTSSIASFFLKLTATTQPSLTQFSGTAVNKVVLSLGKTDGSPGALGGTWNVAFMNGTSTVHSSASVTANQNVSAAGQFTAIRFKNSAPSQWITVKSLTVKGLNCFCAGTLIDTPLGKRPVEDLTAGDKVLTADGKETTVHWLGQQFVDTKLRHPKMVNPICITAGALGGGLPERDLFLSQDHAIAIDGTLYNAGALVNGETIYQVAEMPLDGFSYYHVETDAHELLVAEGVAAESYIDYADRNGFDNAEAGTGREITEMDLPRVSTARMVPEYLKPRKVA